MRTRTRVMISMLIWLCATTCVACQGSSAPAATPSTAAAGPFAFSGGFFALSVADLEATQTWYSQKLGLKVTMRPPKTSGATAVVLEGDGLIVELVQNDRGVDVSRLTPSIQDRTLV